VVSVHGWLSPDQFADVITIAGMSPGPIATNSAVIVGYQTSGLWGAIVSTAGMVLPSLLIIIIVSMFFYKIHKNRIVQSAFYGLRPIITGLIVYAAIIFAVRNQLVGEWNWHLFIMICIFGFSLFALFRIRLHPLYVILLSGLTGAALFS
jgi:chromate transporter